MSNSRSSPEKSPYIGNEGPPRVFGSANCCKEGLQESRYIHWLHQKRHNSRGTHIANPRILISYRITIITYFKSLSTRNSLQCLSALYPIHQVWKSSSLALPSPDEIQLLSSNRWNSKDKLLACNDVVLGENRMQFTRILIRESVSSLLYPGLDLKMQRSTCSYLMRLGALSTTSDMNVESASSSIPGFWATNAQLPCRGDSVEDDVLGYKPATGSKRIHDE